MKRLAGYDIKRVVLKSLIFSLFFMAFGRAETVRRSSPTYSASMTASAMRYDQLLSQYVVPAESTLSFSEHYFGDGAFWSGKVRWTPGWWGLSMGTYNSDTKQAFTSFSLPSAGEICRAYFENSRKRNRGEILFRATHSSHSDQVNYGNIYYLQEILDNTLPISEKIGRSGIWAGSGDRFSHDSTTYSLLYWWAPSTRGCFSYGTGWSPWNGGQFNVRTPSISMETTGPETVRLRVVDFWGNPVKNEVVELECLAVAKDAWFYDINHSYQGVFSGFKGPFPFNELMKTSVVGPITSGSSNPADYFGQLLEDRVTTDENGYAWFRVRYPNRVLKFANQSHECSDMKLHIMACSSQGHLGFLDVARPPEAANFSLLEISYEKTGYTTDVQHYLLDPRAHRFYTLAGQVVDFITGEPAAGVTVLVDGAYADEVTTDADGWYWLDIDFESGTGTGSETRTMKRFELEPLGTVVTCTKEGYAKKSRFIALGDLTAYTLQGRVENSASGSPVEGATVSAESVSTVTAADGSYTLPIQGGGPTQTVNFDFRQGKTSNLTMSKLGFTDASQAVDYTPDSLITGRVIFEGHPVNEATVTLVNEFNSQTVSALTDATGRFSLTLGSGSEAVNAGDVLLVEMDREELADVEEQKSRLRSISDSAVYHFYDVQSIDRYISAYPKMMADAAADEVQKVKDSATRLSNVLLHVAQLDRITEDYAARILETLGSVFSDLLEKTDLVKQWTEIPGGDLVEAGTDKLLMEDVRTGLNKMLQNFVAALGYSMTGSMPAQMQTDTRKFLDNLRKNGSDAFKSEMQESLLAHGLRNAAQQQIDLAVQRCQSLSFSGDTDTQRSLSRNYIQQKHTELLGFVESVNWQELVNTAFSSVEESAKYAKYVGSVVGWYKLIETVEGLSGKLSKALSAGGAGQAMLAFGEMSDHVATVVQLDLGDLASIPSSVVITHQQMVHLDSEFSSVVVFDSAGFPATNGFVQTVQTLRGFVAATNRTETANFSIPYLTAWKAYSQDCTAFLHQYEKQIGQTRSTETARQKLLDAQNANMALVAHALGTTLRLTQEMRKIDSVDYADWTARLDELLLTIETLRSAQEVLAGSMSVPAAWATITSVNFPNGIYTGGVYTVEVTVANAATQPISNLVVSVTGDTAVHAATSTFTLPVLATKGSSNLLYQCTLDSSAFGAYPTFSVQASVNGVEHDLADQTIPVQDHRSPVVDWVWPRADQVVTEAEALIFRLTDNAVVTNVVVDALKINGTAINVGGIHPDEAGWLIIPLSPAISGTTTSSVELAVSDAAGNSTSVDGTFFTENVNFPMFTLLNSPWDSFDPAQTNLEFQFWTGSYDNLEIRVFKEPYGQQVLTQTNAVSAGIQTWSWDGTDQAGAAVEDGSYRIEWLGNGMRLGSRSVQVLDGSGPLNRLEILSSRLLSGGGVWVEVGSTVTGEVVFSAANMLSTTNTLAVGANQFLYALERVIPNEVRETSATVSMAIRTNGTLAATYTFFVMDDRVEVSTEQAELQLTTTSQQVLDEFGTVGDLLRVGLTGLSPAFVGTASYTILDTQNQELWFGVMNPTNGEFWTDWDTAGWSAGTYVLVVQAFSAEGLSVEVMPKTVQLIVDVNANGMDDGWENIYGGNLDPAVDSDADGLTNLEESRTKTSPVNADSDGDGMPDGWEVVHGTNPLVDDAADDSDGDGLNQLGEFLQKSDPRLSDTDADLLDDWAESQHGTDPNDEDSDDDGLSDGEEVLIWKTNPLAKDSDGDGLSDSWELDHGMSPTNAAGATADGDHDGLTNWQEYQNGSDPALADTDGDGLGDAEEVAARTDPNSSDSDQDGLPDGWEVAHGTNPLVDDAAADPDGDGLSNLQEYQNGTHPLRADTDGDTLPDAWEINQQFDPSGKLGRLQGVSLVKAGAFTALNHAQSVDCTNELVYVANGFSGLSILDAQVITNITLLGTLGTTEVVDVAVQDHYAYLACGSSGFKIADISSSTNPVVEGTFSTESYAAQVALKNQIAYVANGNFVSVISCTNAAVPVLSGKLDMGNTVKNLFVEGNTLFAVTAMRLSSFDLTNPALPVFLDRIPLTNGKGVSATGQQVYLSGGVGTELTVVNATNRSAFVVEGRETTYSPDQIVVSDDGLAYAVAGSLGLILYDVRDPADPIVAGLIDTAGFAVDVALCSNYVFVADNSGGLLVFEQAIDSDHDGLLDVWEIKWFGNLAQSANDDPDGDGLSNVGEYQTGTNPALADSDGDNVNDREELLVYASDPYKTDSDGDGYSDGYEVQYGSNPTDAWSIPNVVITTVSLPPATEALPYSATLSATNVINGTPQWSWGITNYTELRGENTFEETGTSLGLHSSSYTEKTVNLPFAFPAMGNSYTQCTVSSAGSLSLGAHYVQISAFFGNLRTDLTGGDVWMNSTSNSVTFRWKGYTDWSHSRVVNCSATLFANGQIRLAYGEGNQPSRYGSHAGVSSGNDSWYSAVTSNSCAWIQDVIYEPNRGLPSGLQMDLDGTISGTAMAVGTNEITLVVRDGYNRTAERTLSIVVQPNPNQKPFLTGAVPTEGAVAVGEQSSRLFSVNATDPEGAPAYEWLLDGVSVGTAATYTFTTQWGDAGSNELQCVLSDDFWQNQTSIVWSITVLDDNDADGLPNSWENQMGLDPWNPADAQADGDADRLNNLGEYQAGTQPAQADTDGDGLLDGWESLYSDPLTPAGDGLREINSWIPAESGWFENIQLVGDRLVLIDSGNANFFSLAAPSMPVHEGALGISDMSSMVQVGDVALVARTWKGFGVYDVSDWDAAVAITNFAYPAYGIAQIGNSLFIASGGPNLDRFDISTPRNPVHLNTLTATSGEVYELATDGTYLYAAWNDWSEGGGGLFIYDAALNLVGSCPGVPGHRLKLVGTRAYISHKYGSGFAVYDISNPTNPTLLGKSTISMEDFDVKGLTFYGCGYNGLFTIDVTDPAVLEIDQTLQLSSGVGLSMVIRGNYAYIGGGMGGGLWTVSLGSTDSDGDGLDDSWETEKFGDLSHDGSADGDHDGLTDREELLLGCDPNQPDSDGDDLPDGWEYRFGLLNPKDAGDSAMDRDHDGVTARQEYIAGTDALNPASRFTIAVHENHVGLELHWNSVSNRTYSIWQSTNLTNWIQLEGQDQVLGDGTEKTVTPPTDSAYRYFRVNVELTQ